MMALPSNCTSNVFILFRLGRSANTKEVVIRLEWGLNPTAPAKWSGTAQQHAHLVLTAYVCPFPKLQTRYEIICKTKDE